MLSIVHAPMLDQNFINKDTVLSPILLNSEKQIQKA